MTNENVSREKLPERVGSWLVIDKLGSGGNAWVYKAKREGASECVALKVLKSQKPVREPYLRFIREADFLRGSSMEDGILPLLDSSVPDNPTKDSPAWLAMPIAQSIRDALDSAPLETVIDAVASIAETLASLAAREIAHRDIKPGNLYRLHDRWLVGDFSTFAVMPLRLPRPGG